jgi:3-oxoacyl-[acyl-carrier-protein] synthase-3
MWVPGGGSAYRPYFQKRMFDDGSIVPIIQGREVFKLAVTLMPEAVNEILSAQGYTLDDLRLLIMHQANLRINEMVQKRLGLPDEKVYNNITKYGNTTAATLPLAFHEARAELQLKKGDLVCFVALGSGVNWGAMLYRY